MGYIIAYVVGMFTGIFAVCIGKAAKRGDEFIGVDEKMRK